MESAYYAGLAVAISIISLLLNLIIFWYDRRSKFVINIQSSWVYDTNRRTGTCLNIKITNASRIIKYIDRCNIHQYGLFRRKKDVILTTFFQTIIDNETFYGEQSKSFNFNMDIINKLFEIYTEDKDIKYFRLAIYDSLDHKFLSNKINIDKIKQWIQQK